MSDDLIVSRGDSITRLTLNRPHKANALSADLVEMLLVALELAQEDGTRLLVLAGAGKHFCSGFDLTDVEESSDGELAARFIRIETLLQRLYHAPFATLALAHGKNVGAGTDLVVACSDRIAASSATFRLPGLQFGVLLGTRRLADRVGSSFARDVLSTAGTVSAESALRSGLLTRCAEIDDWGQLIDERAKQYIRLSPQAMAALHRRTASDTRAEDMAELADSVARPGLKDRLRNFRTAQKELRAVRIRF